MRLEAHWAPHIRTSLNNRKIMGDVIIALLFIYGMCYFYYGKRALILGGVSVAVCIVLDVICTVIAKKKVNIYDYSAIITALIIPLMMPATIPFKVVVAADIFAIVIAKHPFGGVGNNIFNPAAAGLAFATVCFDADMFRFPAPFAMRTYESLAEVKLSAGTSYAMFMGGTPTVSIEEVLFGANAGPMGTTNTVILIACALFLICRSSIHIRQTAITLLSVGVVAFLFPRADISGMKSAILEICATPALFAAVFMFTDPVTTPARNTVKAIYAVVTGIVLMCMRYSGGYQIVLPFTVLLMNAFTPAFDIVAEKINLRIRGANRGNKKTETAD